MPPRELLPEIITDILSRLPTKSILRFQCVSKPWLSIISSPHFPKLHLQQMKLTNSATSRLFLTTHKSFNIEAFFAGDYQKVTLMQHNLPIKYLWNNYFEFVGSCNGLICVAFEEYAHESFVVFNPTTGKVREIFKPKAVHLGCVFYGFGYDSNVDNYKIVTGVFSNSSDATIEIFNLRGNSWRTIRYQHCSSNVFGGKGVLLNGILHWAVYENEYLYAIVRFDILEEKFLDTIPLPSQIDHVNLSLTVIDECLCVSTHNSYVGSFGAWKMMDYRVQDSWARVYQFSNDDFPIYLFQLKLLYIAKTGHLLFAKDADNLIVYNPRDENENAMLLADSSCALGGTIYIESLVSPNIA